MIRIPVVIACVSVTIAGVALMIAATYTIAWFGQDPALWHAPATRTICALTIGATIVGLSAMWFWVSGKKLLVYKDPPK